MLKTAVFLTHGFCLLLLIGSVLAPSTLSAQAKDSVTVTPFSTETDSLPAKNSPKKDSTLTDNSLAKAMMHPQRINWDSLLQKHSPRRAGLYSAIFPGLGQIYNHQYIKVPLMWAGIGIATGVFIFNFDHYVTFRDAYRLRLNGKPTNDPRIDVYSQEDLKYLRDGYRQYVDYSVLGFAAVYLYNILDAVVFGYLYDFDVASPLSRVKFGPVFHQQNAYVGFGITYNF